MWDAGTEASSPLYGYTVVKRVKHFSWLRYRLQCRAAPTGSSRVD